MSLHTIPASSDQDKSSPDTTKSPGAVRKDYIVYQSPPAIKTSKTTIKTRVEAIQDRTGPAVMIPWPRGKKGDNRKWGGYTMEHMRDPAHLARLNDPDTNIGIKNGDPSLGLITYDADSDEGMERLLDLNPICHRTLCTRGMDGANFWFRVPCPSGPTIEYKLNGDHWGERRATGGQTIIHGLHPDTGKPYTFKQDLEVQTLASPDLIKLPDGVVAASVGKSNRAHAAQASHAVHAVQANQAVQAVLVAGGGVVPALPDELLLLCVPKKKRSSDNTEFLLARHVRAWEKKHNGEYCPPDKRAIFERWYLLAAPFLREKKDHYWLEFLRAYGNVKVAWGEDKMAEAWRRANASSPPAQLVECFDDPNLRLLGSLCRELHTLWHPEPFFLGGRKVAELFKVADSTGHLWLCALKGAGVIKLVELGRGIPEAGPDGVITLNYQASTWRYRLNV